MMCVCVRVCDNIYSRVVETFGGLRGSFDQLCPLLLSCRNVHVNPFILKKRGTEKERHKRDLK